MAFVPEWVGGDADGVLVATSARVSERRRLGCGIRQGNGGGGYVKQGACGRIGGAAEGASQADVGQVQRRWSLLAGEA